LSVLAYRLDPALKDEASAYYLSAGVCLLLGLLSWTFTGTIGVAVLVVAALVGGIPIYFDAKRVHLMGVLFVPIAL